jgi:hypothetical protein
VSNTCVCIACFNECWLVPGRGADQGAHCAAFQDAYRLADMVNQCVYCTVVAPQAVNCYTPAHPSSDPTLCVTAARSLICTVESAMHQHRCYAPSRQPRQLSDSSHCGSCHAKLRTQTQVRQPEYANQSQANHLKDVQQAVDTQCQRGDAAPISR